MARCQKVAAMGNSRQNGVGEVVVGIQRVYHEMQSKREEGGGAKQAVGETSETII